MEQKSNKTTPMANIPSILLVIGIILTALYLTEQGQNLLIQLPLPDPLKTHIQTKINQRNKHRTTLTRHIQTLQNDPTNTKAAQAITTTLNNPQTLKTLNYTLIHQSIQTLLQSQPQNPKHHTLLKQLTPKLTKKTAYQIALDTLSQHPQIPQLKTLALDLGRAHYSNLRKNNRLTTYDEQAITNDIQSRAQ